MNRAHCKICTKAYGPDGTNQLRVIFYEADPTTDMNALQGISGSTLAIGRKV